MSSGAYGTYGSQNAGGALTGISAGLSLLNPVFSAFSLIGQGISAIQQKSDQFLANSYASLGGAGAGMQNISNIENNIEASRIAHENNMLALRGNQASLNENIGILEGNREELSKDYRGLTRQIGGQASQMGSYQDLLYSVSGVKNEGVRANIGDYTSEQFAQQQGQLDTNFSRQDEAISKQISFLETEKAVGKKQENIDIEAMHDAEVEAGKAERVELQKTKDAATTALEEYIKSKILIGSDDYLQNLITKGKAFSLRGTETIEDWVGDLMNKNPGNLFSSGDLRDLSKADMVKYVKEIWRV